MNYATIFLLLSTQRIVGKSPLRISGGRNATANEFPYVVEMVFQDNLTPIDEMECYCTAIVVTAQWSLTAAHCGIGSKETAVRNKNKIFKMLNFKPHPKSRFFKYNKKDVIFNDIALLKHDVIDLKEYGKVSAIEYSALYGQEAMCAGYGASVRTIKKRLYNYTKDKGIDHFDYKYPKGLIVLNGLIVKCDENIYFQVLPQICVVASCAGKPTIRVTGPGDSGSPLIHASGIVGVLSSGHPGVLKGQAHAGYYVPTSHILQWMRNEIKADFIVRTNEEFSDSS